MNAKRCCLKCKKKVSSQSSEDFHLIFDENGQELELQKLLESCFNIHVSKKRRGNPGLCSNCVEELVDTFDEKEKDLQENEKIIEIKQEKESSISDSTTVQLCENTFNLKSNSNKLLVDAKKEVKQKTAKRKRKLESSQSKKKTNDSDDVDHEVEDELFNAPDDTDDPLCIEEIFLTSKQDLGKYFLHDDKFKEEEEEEDNKGFEDDFPNEDEFKSELLKTNEESIDIYEYKKSIIKVDPLDNNFKNSLFCVYCKENIIFHMNIVEHSMKHHLSENGLFKCIAKENCEEFEDARELSYHLILKHYDLMFLEINLNCPECKDNYNTFPEYNEHYCCPKGVMNRSKRVCELCKIEFSSHKRFRLHQMFHTSSYRPKICFLCDTKFEMEDDFYEHIMFSHKTADELKLVCKICDKVSSNELLHNKHKKLHLKDSVAKCPICSNSYGSKYRLTLHIRHVHNDREHNDCKICGKEFHFKGQLKLHIDEHNAPKEGKIFICSVCGLCEPDVKYFKNHDHDGESKLILDEIVTKVFACEFCENAYAQPMDLKIHKEKAQHKSYNCDICPEKFERYPLLKSHRLTHDYGNHKLSKYPTGRKYMCYSKNCNASYLHFYELRKHNYAHNWMESSKTCKLCDKTLKNYVGMISHLEKEHSEVSLGNISKFRCSICQNMFKTKNGLGSHMSARHGSNEYACGECKRSFKTKQMLVNHNKHVHDNVVCHMCGKTLRNKHLQYHINAVHKKIIRFRCDQCDKGYYLNSDLQDHIKLMHTSNKPEKCDQCPFSCHYPSRLKLHILQKHEGKPPPFKCEECSAGFFTKNTLRSHMIRHGVKAFKCLVSECKSEFHTRAHLINHGRKIHKMEFGPSLIKQKRKPRIKKKTNKPQIEVEAEDPEYFVEVLNDVDEEEQYAMEIEYLEEDFSEFSYTVKTE